MTLRTESARIGRESESLSTRNGLRLIAGLALLCGASSAQSAADADRSATPHRVFVDLAPAAPQATFHTEWVAAANAWHLVWEGLAPGAVVVPLVRLVLADSETTSLPLHTAPLLVDSKGVGQMMLPRPASLVGEVSISRESSGGGGTSPLAQSWPPQGIAGWLLQAVGWSYSGDHYVGTLESVAPPPPQSQSTLWAVVLEEGPNFVKFVNVTAFDPYSLVEQPLAFDDYHAVDAGHVLALRVFATAPTENLANSVLLWQSPGS